MTIYLKRASTTITRKIYIKHFGNIPKDGDGRSYEIHHIDGNHSNNDPSNLRAVTIKEHYDIHYSNGDYGACYAIAVRMNKSSEEISNLASLSNLQRIKEGNHNFQKREDGTSSTGDDFKSGRRTHRGDRNPRFNHNLYNFRNKYTNEIVTMTQFEFIENFKLNKGAVCSMIKNKKGHKSVKGWELF